MYSRKGGSSNNQSVYKFASVKMGKVIRVESSLEYDACFHLEYSKDITSFVSQPCGVEYVLNGIKRTFFPDFLAESQKHGLHYLEIKRLNLNLEPNFGKENRQLKI
ncbi:hypothetical protein [Photobacterium profundum]|nr:hypothetical protein [Photobacterium profundum]